MEYASLREKIAAEKAERADRYAGFAALYEKARAAGIAAGEAAVPRPMVVSQHANPMDDSSPAVKRYYEADGACGFAWVTVRPGNSSFAKWLVKHGRGRAAYAGGVSIWVSEHDQSYERKLAHAGAMAKVLSEAGIKAYADGRLD